MQSIQQVFSKCLLTDGQSELTKLVLGLISDFHWASSFIFMLRMESFFPTLIKFGLTLQASGGLE